MYEKNLRLNLEKSLIKDINLYLGIAPALNDKINKNLSSFIDNAIKNHEDKKLDTNYFLSVENRKATLEIYKGIEKNCCIYLKNSNHSFLLNLKKNIGVSYKDLIKIMIINYLKKLQSNLIN